MEAGLDPELRNELIEGRDRITAQLDELRLRSTPRAGRIQPPDYREVYAELERELREINELLESDEADGEKRA